MRYGLVIPNEGATIEKVMEWMAYMDGLHYDSAWMPGIPNGPDILTLLAVAGLHLGRGELGTAVVPAFPRHPAALAVQALAVNDALAGRFTLGVGLSHQKVVERLGLSYERPVAYMTDYLHILRPLLETGEVDYTGSRLSTRLRLDVARAAPKPPSVLLAALGPQMLRLAGRTADGVMTWMTGMRTIESHVVPTVRAAAEEAGRPPPRVLVSLPVMVTSDEARARELATEQFGVYGRLPAYQAMFEREGVAGPADVALVGDEDALIAGLRQLRDVGVTDLQVTPFGDRVDVGRTVELLGMQLV